MTHRTYDGQRFSPLRVSTAGPRGRPRNRPGASRRREKQYAAREIFEESVTSSPLSAPPIITRRFQPEPWGASKIHGGKSRSFGIEEHHKTRGVHYSSYSIEMSLPV